MNNGILAIYFYKKFNFHYIHYNYNNFILYTYQKITLFPKYVFKII